MAKMTNTYELMYVVNTVISDDQVKDIVKRVAAYIEENGARVLEVNEMGSQRLAYPIEKKRNGYYAVVYFETEDRAFIPRFERALRINDDILRHMILRHDTKMLRHYQQQKSAPAEEAEA